MNLNALGRVFIIPGTPWHTATIVMHRIPPGDIYIQKKKFSFFFPVTTCLIISAAISLLLNFLGKK